MRPEISSPTQSTTNNVSGARSAPFQSGMALAPVGAEAVTVWMMRLNAYGMVMPKPALIASSATMTRYQPLKRKKKCSTKRNGVLGSSGAPGAR